MFSAPVIGLLVGASTAAWVYSKVGYRTGGNAKQAAIAAGMAGVFSFIFIVIIVSFIDSYLGS
jgi:hypothetical protein